MKAASSTTGFGLAQIKAQGTSIRVDPGSEDSIEPVVATTWFEFNVEDSRIQDVVDHLKKIGIDCDPRQM